MNYGVSYSTMTNLRKKLAAMPHEKRLYTLQTLPTHLVHADQINRARTILLDLSFMEIKLAATDPAALVGDTRLLEKGDQVVHIMRSFWQISAHVLGRSENHNQLYNQLIGRLGPHEDEQPKIAALLADTRHAAEYNTRPMLILQSSSLPSVGSFFIRKTGLRGRVRAMAFSSDGQYLIIAYRDNTIDFIDIDNFMVVRQMAIDVQTEIESISVTGTLLIVKARVVRNFSYNRITILSLQTGDHIYEVEINRECIFALNDNRIFVGYGHQIRSWNIAVDVSNERLITLNDDVITLEVSNDVLIIGQAKGSIMVWNTRLWSAVITNHGFGTDIINAELINGKVYIALLNSDRLKIVVWDTETDITKNMEVSGGNYAHKVGFVIANDVVYGVYSSRLFAYDPVESKIFLHDPVESFGVDALATNGEYLVAATSVLEVCQFDVDWYKKTTEREWIKFLIARNDVALSVSRGRQTEGYSFKLWNLSIGDLINEFNHEDVGESISILDSRLIAISSTTSVKIIDVVYGVEYRSITNIGRIVSVFENYVVSRLNDDSLRIQDMITNEINIIPVQYNVEDDKSSTIMNIKIVDNLLLVITQNSNETHSVQVWDWRNGTLLGMVRIANDYINDTTITNGKLILLSSLDQEITVCNYLTNTVENVVPLQGRFSRSFINGMSTDAIWGRVNPSGNFVVTWSNSFSERGYRLILTGLPHIWSGAIAVDTDKNCVHDFYFETAFRHVALTNTQIVVGDEEGRLHILRPNLQLWHEITNGNTKPD